MTAELRRDLLRRTAAQWNSRKSSEIVEL